MIASYFFGRIILAFARKELGSTSFKVVQQHPNYEDKILYSTESKEQAENYLYFLNNNMIRHDKNFTYCIIEEL